MKNELFTHPCKCGKVVSFHKTRLSRLPQLSEFVPYFQPVVDLRTGCTVGLEQLARWHHPTKGLLLPGSFIEEAETGGWIGDLMYVLLDASLNQLQSLPEQVCLSFNLSPSQLLDRRLPAKLASIARSTCFPLQRLTAEITENALAQDQSCALSVARELKAMGCKLSLDDFGTGYSSLLHLQSLPFDEIKVDRSFVASMLERKECRKIVSAVIGLGRSLGIRTVAEGIEDSRQVDMLNWLGCDLGQGWLFGRPLQSEALPPFLSHRNAVLAERQVVSANGMEAETPAEQSAELRALYEAAPVGFAFLDTNLRFRNLNKKMAEMNGVPIQQHLGKHVSEILPALFCVLMPCLRRALAGEAIRDVEIRVPDILTQRLRDRRVSFQPARDEAGEVIGVSVTVVDLTSCTRSSSLATECHEAPQSIKASA